jgi:DNA-binding transcriptional LysR family regulator
LRCYARSVGSGNAAAFIGIMSAMHVDELDLSQVRLLAELSRLRNLSRAAHRIGVSQSAASHALAKARKRLGDPLFIRMENGFQPTPFGARVSDACCEALDVLLAGLASSDEFDPLKSSRVFSFFMNDIGQTVFLPPLLKLLKEKASGVSVRVLPVPLENPAAAPSSGAVDFAAGLFDNLERGFLQRRLFRERYVCIVRAGHPKFQAGITLEAFRNAEQAVADATGMAHAIIDRVLARHHIKRKVALRVPGLHVLPMIVANSDLMAIVPARLADAFAARISIKVLPPPIALPSFDVCIHWHERYHRDPAMRWMRQNFAQIFAKQA